MSSKIAKQADEQSNPKNIKDPSLGWIIGFLFLVSFLGLFCLVPLRKIMIIDYKLVYPSGTATAHLINGFHTPAGAKLAKFYFDFNATYVGVGMICPYIVNLSVLFGADPDSSNLHGLQGYRVFISIAMILGDGLYNFVKVLCRTIPVLITQIRGGAATTLPISDSPIADAPPAITFDDQRRTEVFLKDQIPNWVAIVCYIAVAVVSTFTLPQIFNNLKWYYIVVAYIVAPVLAFCNAYGCGLTDWSLASTYGKLAIFTIGAWAGASNGGVLVGLAACGVMMSIVSTASDLMQDFKTGYMTLASPRSMFVSQVIGTGMGCIIGPSIFWIFFKAFDLGNPKSAYPAPLQPSIGT
ncbi:putative metal-nicotianamine transporter YSL7 [Acorus calamus]|uniref:Metal-nicotianamine transporter YSL7 n=1 Tax=Acorus calamus TaxID=4465 RepID=A0AAV9D708_ACOCL|nr:putative metal-nicotianamine transporter YSL7 [Acorus calamus]